MKNILIKFGIVCGLLMICILGISVQTVSAFSDPADGLDLSAVAELFKDSDNLEKFEQTLNSSDNGINNLDLNNDDKVDFIRVAEQAKDDTRLIVLQTPLGENDFQDVATIAVERENGGTYNLQVQGDTTIYGANYYIVPANKNFSAWNIIRWIFTPNYRPYVSVYNYRTLPNWWNVRRPVAVAIYRTRTGIFAGRKNFVASKTVTVKTIHKVKYTPRSSVLVTRKTKVVNTSNNGGRNTTVVKTKVSVDKTPNNPAPNNSNKPKHKGGTPRKGRN
jgi:hypothetical protein